MDERQCAGASENNRAIIESLETAQFVLCLDEPYPEPHMKDRDIDVQLQMLLHGGGARLNSNNRWFDKCIQVRVFSHDYFAEEKVIPSADRVDRWLRRNLLLSLAC